MNKLPRIVLAAIVLLAIVAAIYLPYRSEHNKNVMLQQAVSAQKRELAQTAKAKDAPGAKPTAPIAQHGTTYISKKGVSVLVYAPFTNDLLNSPVGVIGQVPGTWSNEGQFAVLLKDSTGTVVAQGTAQLLDDWTTNQPVPFSVKLTYGVAAAGKGTLVLQKDNQSGDPNNDDSVVIPVRF